MGRNEIIEYLKQEFENNLFKYVENYSGKYVTLISKGGKLYETQIKSKNDFEKLKNDEGKKYGNPSITQKIPSKRHYYIKKGIEKFLSQF